MFDCGADLCGKIIWLKFTRPPGRRFDHDKFNPRPALRRRPLCGLTIITGLAPAGAGRWQGGSFYNPKDGRTYGVNAKLAAPGKASARFYVGAPLFGETKELKRFEPKSACG